MCGLSLSSSSLSSCCYKVVIPVGPGLVRVTKSREQHDGSSPSSSSLPITTLPTPVVPIPTEAVPKVAVANDATVLIIVVVLGLADAEILTPISGFLLSIFLPSTKPTTRSAPPWDRFQAPRRLVGKEPCWLASSTQQEQCQMDDKDPFVIHSRWIQCRVVDMQTNNRIDDNDHNRTPNHFVIRLSQHVDDNTPPAWTCSVASKSCLFRSIAHTWYG